MVERTDLCWWWKSPEEGERAGSVMAAPTSDSLLYAGRPAESHPAESSQPLCDLCVDCTDEEQEDRRGKMTCPRSQNK